MNQISNFYPWPKSAIQVAKSSCIGRGGKSPCLPAPKHTAFAAFAALAVPAEHELQIPDNDVADTRNPDTVSALIPLLRKNKMNFPSFLTRKPAYC
jgi:hypothetical protein